MDWAPPQFQQTLGDGRIFEYPASLSGPTVILFWATWCPYCKALMPHLQSILDEYDGEVSVLTINFREDGDPAAVLSKYGYQFVLLPEADEVAASWGVKATPGLFLADASGKIVFSRQAIAQADYPEHKLDGEDKLKNSQKAARMAPFWAARLRMAIDLLLD